MSKYIKTIRNIFNVIRGVSSRDLTTTEIHSERSAKKIALMIDYGSSSRITDNNRRIQQ